MNAAIGRLHLSVTVAVPAERVRHTETKQNKRLERAYARQMTQRAIDRERVQYFRAGPYGL